MSIETYLNQFHSGTRATYRAALNRLGRRNFDTITADEIPPLIATLRAKYKPATVAVCRVALMGYLRFCRKLDAADVLKDTRVEVGDNVPLWNVLQPGDDVKLLAAARTEVEKSVLLALLRQTE